MRVINEVERATRREVKPKDTTTIRESIKPYIKNKPDEKEFKAMKKDMRDKVKKEIDLFDAAARFLEKTPVEDKELIALARRFASSENAFYLESIGAFKEAVSILAKAEKTLLASKGFTANDNIDEMIDAYRKDLKEAKNHLEYLEGSEQKREVMAEVRERKERMAVAGKFGEERVKEFASLNYLLSYKFADQLADSSIPKGEKPTQGSHQSQSVPR